MPGRYKLKDYIQSEAHLYCPKCKKVEATSFFSSKRQCKECAHEHVLIALSGVNRPIGYAKRTKKRRIISLIFTFVMITLAMIPCIMALIYTNAFRLPDNPTTAQQQAVIGAWILNIAILIPMTIGILLFTNFYAWKPEEKEHKDFVEKLIRKHLPNDVSELPIIVNEKDIKDTEWQKDTIGMRYLELRKYQET